MNDNLIEDELQQSNFYFTSDIDDAIIRYNSSTDDVERNIIYNEYIHPALTELVSSIIHRFNFYAYDTNIEDLESDVLSYLQTRLSKFDPKSGKAFSFFSVVAKNYLISKTNKRRKNHFNHVDLMHIDSERDVVNDTYSEEHRGDLIEFVNLWAMWGYDNLEIIFENEQRRTIAEALFILFKKSHEVPIYNKRAINVLIKEYAKDVTTADIRGVVNIVKKKFYIMYNDYKKNPNMDWNKYKEKKWD